MPSYPNRIRELRKLKDLSGVDVAEYLGITPQYLYNLEKGTRSLSTEIASKLAEYFNVSVDYLLGRSVEKSSKTNPLDIPEWASAKDIADFKKMLEDDKPVMFDGVPIEGEKRQRVLDVLTGLFWEAKELNKETYGRKNNKTKNTSNDNKE
ncbi:helix-turn-helix domain-containing protein [Paenibacillus sp. FSL H8-0457]|uniref:helix-turn-helix domain-containing protein n=1 Tax=unclassified Paenibacillus TaxID=185978 RepID=UPI0003E25042|nr:helix-turn-helix domain-containing protein [Paenibacillus sp. FSL H8-457]ETT58206.1 HTH-type transcriptional regulator ansR [Paenibacillus sp. FSL H8-457]